MSRNHKNSLRRKSNEKRLKERMSKEIEWRKKLGSLQSFSIYQLSSEVKWNTRIEIFSFALSWAFYLQLLLQFSSIFLWDLLSCFSLLSARSTAQSVPGTVISFQNTFCLALFFSFPFCVVPKSFLFGGLVLNKGHSWNHRTLWMRVGISGHSRLFINRKFN